MQTRDKRESKTNNQTKRTVSVSHLASFCADKNEFIKSRGKAADKQAAAAGTIAHETVGTKAHHQVGTKSSGLMKVILVFLFGLICLYMYYSR